MGNGRGITGLVQAEGKQFRQVTFIFDDQYPLHQLSPSLEADLDTIALLQPCVDRTANESTHSGRFILGENWQGIEARIVVEVAAERWT
jgi:hypothetical protein